MAEENNIGSAAAGADIPAEALQQGNQNINHPNFRITRKEDIAETEGTEFGQVEGGRGKYVKPGRYPTKSREVPTTGDKRTTMKGTMQRTDH